MKEVTDWQLFVTFLVLNSILWFYCYYFLSKSPSHNDKINAWTEYYLLHDVFDVILCVTAILSLLQRIEEYYVLSFACAYFVVDFFDCIIRKSWMFLFHAVLAILLIWGGSKHAIHGELRSVSKGCLVEICTPFLHKWQRTKSKRDYTIFYILFFFCRVVWVPYFLYETQKYMGFLEVTVFVGYVFCLLQLAWFTKMTQILLNYKESDVKKVQ